MGDVSLNSNAIEKQIDTESSVDNIFYIPFR